jgi:teichoic acid transport system permease protein
MRDNWRWQTRARKQAFVDFRSTFSGGVLGWTWQLLKPAVFIACFWFTLQLGLKVTNPSENAPYLIWLAAGLMPWFFIRNMIWPGFNVFRSSKYLSSNVDFPLAVIPRFVTSSNLLGFLTTLPLFALIFVLYRFPLTIYAVQLPVLIVLLYFFFQLCSLMASSLCAMSDKFMAFTKACSIPVFLLSGFIFDVKSIDIVWLQRLLEANPVTFFINAFRAALCDRYWIWEKQSPLIIFAVVFLLVFYGAVRSLQRLEQVLADQAAEEDD